MRQSEDKADRARLKFGSSDGVWQGPHLAFVIIHASTVVSDCRHDQIVPDFGMHKSRLGLGPGSSSKENIELKVAWVTLLCRQFDMAHGTVGQVFERKLIDRLGLSKAAAQKAL